jgi:hypothetical protein
MRGREVTGRLATSRLVGRLFRIAGRSRGRPAPSGAAESRAATDALLTVLAAGRWRPSAWGRFLAEANARSWQQALAHRRAVGELALLHTAFALLAGRRARTWVAASGTLAIMHLGMLGRRPSLGVANTITLTRANLPALLPQRPGWLGVAALGSDLLDGWLARRLRTETAFGAYADSLADAAFWLWFSGAEPSRQVRTASRAVWALPVAAASVLSIARGRMIDPPRPAVLRPAAALQLALALRALRGAGGSPAR